MELSARHLVILNIMSSINILHCFHCSVCGTSLIVSKSYNSILIRCFAFVSRGFPTLKVTAFLIFNGNFLLKNTSMFLLFPLLLCRGFHCWLVLFVHKVVVRQWILWIVIGIHDIDLNFGMNFVYNKIIWILQQNENMVLYERNCWNK